MIFRLSLCQLFHASPFLPERLHVDPVLLHHIVDRMVVEDVRRRSALHSRVRKGYNLLGDSIKLADPSDLL